MSRQLISLAFDAGIGDPVTVPGFFHPGNLDSPCHSQLLPIATSDAVRVLHIHAGEWRNVSLDVKSLEADNIQRIFECECFHANKGVLAGQEIVQVLESNLGRLVDELTGAVWNANRA